MDRSDQGVHSKLIPVNRILLLHSGLLHRRITGLPNQDRHLAMEGVLGAGNRSIFMDSKGQYYSLLILADADYIATTWLHTPPRFARMDSLLKLALRASSTHIVSRTNIATSSSKYSLAFRVRPSEEVIQVTVGIISTSLKTVGFQVPGLPITGSTPREAEADTFKICNGQLAVAAEDEVKQILLMLHTTNRDTLKVHHNYSSNNPLMRQPRQQMRMAITHFGHRRICRLKIRAVKILTSSAEFLLAARRCHPHHAKLPAAKKERRAPRLALRSRTKVPHLPLPSQFQT
jgi:hypothetical protein